MAFFVTGDIHGILDIGKLVKFFEGRENDFSKEEVNMGMLSIHEVKLYPYEKLEEEMYSEFMTDELLLNTPGATLDDVVEITEDGAEYRYQ